METVPPLMVIPALAVSFCAYKIYPGSREPVVVIIVITWVTPIVIIKPLGIIGMVGVSLAIYIIIWVIIISITGESVIISVNVWIYITVVIVVIITVGRVLIMVIWIIPVPLVPTVVPVSYTHLDVYKRQVIIKI